MIYLIAFVLPPAAVYMTKPEKTVLNIVLTLLFYVPGFVHAIMIINESKKAAA